MMKTIILLFTFISISVTYSQAKGHTSIPFTVEKNCIYFYCKINESDSLKFLFDTGADGSVINKQSVSKINLEIDSRSLNIGANGQNEVERSTKNEILLGTILRKETSFTIIPYETDKFDGVLGTDLMKGYIIEIDYYNQVINFYAEDDKDINYKGYKKLKLYDDLYPTYIKSAMLINGKKYTGFFGLDTGADDPLTIASPFAKKNDFINKMTRIGAANFQGSDGSVQELPIVLCPEVQFADNSLYRVPVALSNATEGIDASDKLAGFYGNDFLKKFNTIIDYKNHLIYFRLNQNLYSEFYAE